MHSLNLRNLLLTGSAFILMGFIIIFPIYFILAIIDDETITFFAFIILAIGSCIYGYVRQNTYMTTILKLSLFTSTYIFMLATLLNYESALHVSEKNILLISAVYFAIIQSFFRNPFIKILTLTAALMLLNVYNNLFMMSLVVLVVLGLSQYALRFYTLLIALSLQLLSWPLWESLSFNHSSSSFITPMIAYLLLGLSFAPYLMTHWKNQSQQQNIFYLLGIVGLLILTYFLPISIIAGILIITVGLYLQSRTLHIIGLLLLSYSLFMYYYNLESSLSAKGIILITTGIVILIARYAFHYFGKIRHEN